MADLAEVECADPGAGGSGGGPGGGRLASGARAGLAREIREWRRRGPGAVLIEVRGDAWCHAPAPGDVLDRERIDAEYQAVVAGLFGLGCPVVVSLDGRVSGFGLALAMACDVRLATERTTFAVGAGRPLDALLGGVSWLLTRAAGAGTFAQLAWTGGELRAGEAARRGLLVRSDDPGAARALAARLAADPAGSSALKRALTSRYRAELGIVHGYESWLADVAAGGPTAD